MKKIIPLVASIILILIAGIFASAGTIAQFHDEETVGVHDIQAGTLNLKVGNNDPSTVHITIPNLAPMGAFARALKCTIKNTGTLSGKLSIEISDIKNYENDRIEPEEAEDPSPGPYSGELGDYLKVRMELDFAKFLEWPVLNDLSESTIVPPNDVFEPSEAKIFNLWYWLPLNTGNIVQSDSVEFDIIFHLDQA